MPNIPLWLINYIGGLLIGYYLLNPQFRHLTNLVFLTLLKLAHKITIFLLSAIVKGLEWCYKTRQKPLPTQARPIPNAQRPQPAPSGISMAKTTILDNGSRALVLTPQQLEELMVKNKYLRISEKRDNK